MSIERRVDWNNLVNNVAQHRLRYQDRSLHLAFLDTSKSVAFTGKGGTLKSIPKDELTRMRDFALDATRRNYLDTGGDKAAIDQNIDFGRGMNALDPDAIAGVGADITIIRRKL